LKVSEDINLNSFFKNEHKQISICACDAGSAEHILQWTKNIKKRIKYSLNGPALSIFTKENKSIKNLSIEECLDGSQLHIAGTAWSSDFEIYSTKLAKEKSIYTISVLDHWVSYPQRFLYQDELILPDEIWVSDEIAKEIASHQFQNIKVSILPNLWMHNLKKKVDLLFKELNRSKNIPAFNLLYLLEPIRPSKQWETKYKELSEFDALRYFIERIKILQNLNFIDKRINKINLRLRLHPSEKSEKYINFLNKLNTLINYEISISQNLEEDLAWSDIAFGVETQALICALECGIISISTKPKWAQKCSLPHKDLLHLHELE